MPKTFKLSKLEMTAIRFLRLALWNFFSLTIHLNLKNSKDPSLPLVFNTVVIHLNCFLMIMAFFKEIIISSREVKAIEAEKAHSKANLNFFKSRKELYSKLRLVEVDNSMPNSWIFTSAEGKILISLDKERIYSDVKQWNILLNILSKSSTNIPRKLELANMLSKPIGTDSDWMAKIRKIDQDCYGTGSILLVMTMLVYLQYSTIDILIVSFFTAIAATFLALRENFLQADEELRFNLIGIQKRLTPYDDFPQTCVGQQIMSKRLFVGPNAELEKAIGFLAKVTNFVDENSTSELSKLPIWNTVKYLREQMRNYFDISEKVSENLSYQ